ncbi:CD63 antigen isoform X1 [Nasonia vitripennis]|uniref:Tetraspanin n=2 Tax=Pteromalinae TaxID=272242 RepID=A0A7M7G3Z8_NASVI|nr:CD63 antigen isoform X1 [Nasonia vitripennis]OXU31611.1 hypothetical protein TSAR_007013 [Trichomalopsis sarcophagae]
MSCASGCIKYLLFIFNFLFALGGLAILICGILLQIAISDVKTATPEIPTSMPITVLIIVGAVIFIIAFFGCCGAIRESHCMIITFAVLLLTLLVIQVAVAAYAFVQFKGDDSKGKIEDLIHDMVNKYFDDKKYQDAVNAMQTFAQCCGYNSYRDYTNNDKNINGSIPYSCCDINEGKTCSVDQIKFHDGCRDKVYTLYKKFSNGLAGLAIGIAVVELIGIIFSFCLANSIRNVQRRGYKV